MSRYRITFVLFTISLFCSCTTYRLTREIEEFTGQQINISKDWHTVWKGKDTLLYRFSEAPVKLVIWFDSLSCASCQIVRMYEWNNIIAYADSFEKRFHIIFLFTPNSEDLYETSLMLKRISFGYPVFIDQEKNFVKQNPKLPRNRQLHSFLLDKNNKVVLVGSPLYNPSLWKLYQNTIQKMIDNGGVLPEKKLL